jgi:hypothetical protein
MNFRFPNLGNFNHSLNKYIHSIFFFESIVCFNINKKLLFGRGSDFIDNNFNLNADFAIPYDDTTTYMYGNTNGISINTTTPTSSPAPPPTPTPAAQRTYRVVYSSQKFGGAFPSFSYRACSGLTTTENPSSRGNVGQTWLVCVCRFNGGYPISATSGDESYFTITVENNFC